MAIRLKDFMNIQTGFFVFIVVVIIVVGMSMSSENNYLNPSGNRNPANQKLMVVDQDSGEISFIQKSLQGVNAQIVADDSVILKKIEDLEKLNGDRSAEIQAIQRDYATKSYVDTELGKKEGNVNWSDVVLRGASYEIQVTDSNNDHRVLDVWNGNLSAAGGGSGCVNSGGGKHRLFCLR